MTVLKLETRINFLKNVRKLREKKGDPSGLAVTEEDSEPGFTITAYYNITGFDL